MSNPFQKVGYDGLKKTVIINAVGPCSFLAQAPGFNGLPILAGILMRINCNLSKFSAIEVNPTIRELN